MVVCKNCDSPKSSDDPVTDGAHKLVFVMCSADTPELSAQGIVLDCSFDDIGMEPLMQAAVGVEPLVEDLLTTNNDDAADYDKQLVNNDGAEKENQELADIVGNEDEVTDCEQLVDEQGLLYPEEPNNEEQQVIDEMVQDQEQLEQHEAEDPANNNIGKDTTCIGSFIACLLF